MTSWMGPPKSARFRAQGKRVGLVVLLPLAVGSREVSGLGSVETPSLAHLEAAAWGATWL